MKTRKLEVEINLFTPTEFFAHVVYGMHVTRAYVFYHKKQEELTDADILMEVYHGVSPTQFYPTYSVIETIKYHHYPVDYSETKEAFCEKYDALEAIFITIKGFGR